MSIIEGIIDGGSGGGGGPTTPPIGSIGLGRWTFNSSGSPASAGQISFNNVAPALATELYIATVNLLITPLAQELLFMFKVMLRQIRRFL